MSSNLKCEVCDSKFSTGGVIPSSLVRPPIAELVRKDHPDWSEKSYICLRDLNSYRSRYVQNSLESERGELTELEVQVVESLREHEILSGNVNVEYEQQETLGNRVADRVASFGGSWTFIIIFGSVLAVWILINSIAILMRPFDPFPYILLNLVLSCLAAIQAPVIMMSQNRQESKDRIRAEHDYQINLKAELEIRHLHSKFDLLLTHQWQRLLEIQQLQTDLLEEIANKNS